LIVFVLFLLAYFLTPEFIVYLHLPKSFAHSPRRILLSFILLLGAAISFVALLAAVTWKVLGRPSQ